MSNIDPRQMGLFAKTGGLTVGHVIREMEQRMAAGQQVSAAPSDAAEADLLRQVKQENDQSAQNARR